MGSAVLRRGEARDPNVVAGSQVWRRWRKNQSAAFGIDPSQAPGYFLVPGPQILAILVHRKK